MKKILILYSTVDGHTHTICQYIAEKISEMNNHHQSYSVELQVLSDFAESNDMNPNFKDIDTIIIGASIRYGKHRPYVHEFVEKYKSNLEMLNTAFFSVNLVARKSEKNTAETNSYVQKFIEATGWQPNVVDVFGGKLDYSIYGFFDKMMIKLIMKITKGETSSDKPIIYTDWARVEKFAQNIVKLTN